MKRLRLSFLILAAIVACPFRSPAPLLYRPGEGWTYELPGGKGDWHRQRAKDQLTVAQQAFDQEKYRLALKAAERVIVIWPLSDYAPQAQYLIGRCYEARHMDEKAFNAYQNCLEKYPKMVNTDEIQKRQFTIAVRFLHGEWFKLFGYVPFFPNMEKTAEMFDKIVRYGPYGTFAPEAQMDIGAAREKQKDFPSAVKAYERAADRYSGISDPSSAQGKLAADALFKAALAYEKQARKADYDQSIAGQAMATYKEFMDLYPGDSRLTAAQRSIDILKAEQARGNFRVAQFYEKGKKWDGALIYYNEVMLKDAGSPLAAQARQRIEALKQRTTPKPVQK